MQAYFYRVVSSVGFNCYAKPNGHPLAMIISRNPGSNIPNIKYKTNSLDKATMQADGRQEEERRMEQDTCTHP